MESLRCFNIVMQSSVNGLFATKTIIVSNNISFRVYFFEKIKSKVLYNKLKQQINNLFLFYSVHQTLSCFTELVD